MTITENGSVERSFRAVDLVRWEHIEVDISDYEDMDPFEREIDRQIDLALERSDGRHLVYRVHLSGRGPLHGLVNHQEYAEELSSRMNDGWSNRSPFAYCDRVTVTTRQDINRDDLIKREDFVGDLLRFFDESRGSDANVDDLLAGLKPLYENPRLRKYLSDNFPQGTELAALLDEAETICLDLLANEESDED